VAYHDGRLIDVAYQLSRGSEENRKAVSELLGKLHNKGDIDLLEAYLSFNNTVGGADFFLARRLFEKVLPRLDAPVEKVMQCIQHLFHEAGNDLAARLVFEPFIEFLSVDNSRALSAMEIIRESSGEMASLVCPVIMSGSGHSFEGYFEAAVNLIAHDENDISINAIFSLGRLTYPESSTLKVRAVDELMRIAEKKSSDSYMAVVIKTASSLAKQDASLVESVCAVIRVALHKGGNQALHAATDVFGFDTNNLPAPLLRLLVSNLSQVKPENTGSINNIDMGISGLLKNDPKQAIDCLESILLSNPEKLNINLFDSVVHKILSSQLPEINQLLTRWFLKGDRILCTALMDIIEQVHGKQMALQIDHELLPNSDPVTYFYLARKAIGYLFLKPITVTSIILSLMRITKDEEVLDELEDLLLDPLLLNYPGKTRAYLESCKPNEPEYIVKAIESVIERLDTYLEKLRNIGDVPELFPTLRQREAYIRNFNQQMSVSYKQAMKGSIVEMLATKSVILYGRSSVNYIRQPYSDSSRMEIPMQHHSVEMEFPRRHNLDPFGLDYMLRVFRAERMVAQ